MRFGIPALEDTYYGSYRTRTFAEIFPNLETFLVVLRTDGIFGLLFSPEVKYDKLYILLYGRYGNSHVAFSDENQFKFRMASIIWQYGPTWNRRVEIQEKLRKIPDEELMTGGKAIYNHSFNPSTTPSTSSLQELLTINDQNTTNYKHSRMDAYANLLALL